MVTPEFARPERIDTIGERARTVEIAATAEERAALATRFGLIALEALGAAFELRRTAAGIEARGRVRGRVVQACVVTGDPVPAAIDEPVALRFVPEGDEAPAEEIEIEAEALDTIGYRGGAIDLGETAAETLALALDPFPRSPGAAQALREAGVLSEEEAAAARNPFAALKDKMGTVRP